jgi:hypothetical protein
VTARSRKVQDRRGPDPVESSLNRLAFGEIDSRALERVTVYSEGFVYHIRSRQQDRPASTVNQRAHQVCPDESARAGHGY